MIYSILGKTNLRVSRLGLGTVQFGMDYGFTKAKSQAEVDRILNAAGNFGINFLDTAREYGDSEEKIGRFLRNNRHHKFIMATKIAKISPVLMNQKQKLSKHILRSAEISLKKLKVQKIDILQLHQTDAWITGNGLFWDVVHKLKQKGIFKYFGISVYDTEMAQSVISKHGRMIDVIQLPFSVFDQRFTDLVSLFKKYNLGVISRSAFLRGMITEGSSKIPNNLMVLKNARSQLQVVASGLNAPSRQLALSFVLCNSFVQSTIVGVNSLQELKDNVDAFKKVKTVQSNMAKFRKLKVDDVLAIDPRRWDHPVKVLAIVQARMSSTRLPGKVMMKVLGKPLIGHLLERLSLSKKIDKIIVASSVDKKNDGLCAYVRAKGFDVYRGDENDVLDRFYKAACRYCPQIVVRITGDCPLVDFRVVDQVISYYQSHRFDYVSNTNPATYPDGLDVEVFSFCALKKAWQEAKHLSDREHVTPYIVHRGKFKRGSVKLALNLSAERWTVDNKKDFLLIKNIIENLSPTGEYFGFKDILDYKKNHKKIFWVNKHFERNEGYVRSLKNCHEESLLEKQ